jgi:hypothetical protein
LAGRRVTQSAAPALAEARDALHRGLLEEAARALARVTPEAPVPERAAGALLSGNLAYERGRYAEAEAAWRTASTLYAEASDSAGHSTALANLDLATERLARRAQLESRADTLQATVLLLVLAAALGVAYLARRSGG